MQRTFIEAVALKSMADFTTGKHYDFEVDHASWTVEMYKARNDRGGWYHETKHGLRYSGRWRIIPAKTRIVQAAVAIAVVMALFIAAPATAQTFPWHEGNLEKEFPQWKAMIEAYPVQQDAPVADADRLALAHKLQAQFAKKKYIEDITNYGKSDYWATPDEFEAHGGGDCEDFAIAEYFAFVKAGIPDSDLLIITGIRYDGAILHTMLKLRIGAAWYVLDSNRPEGVFSEDYWKENFKFIYEMNRLGWRGNKNLR